MQEKEKSAGTSASFPQEPENQPGRDISLPEIRHHQNFLWTPVRSKPRQEKKLAGFCAANGIQVYLPLRKVAKRYQRRTVENEIPMFPGYIFCCLDEEAFRTMCLAGAVLYRIGMDKELEKTLIRELNSLRILERASEDVELIVAPEIIKGAQVKITNGPMRGISGVVLKRRKKMTITVNIELLGQSATAEIDVGDLEIE